MKFVAWILVLIVALSVAPRLAMAQAADPDKVSAAIKKAQEYIYSQEKNGTWESTNAAEDEINTPAAVTGGQWGGLTAVATYALLASGEAPSKLAAPIKFLEKAQIDGIYAIGFRAQIWHLIPPAPDNRAALLRDAKLLLLAIEKETGKYDYTTRLTHDWDNSVSQYGVLGVWACAQEGVEIPDWYWKLVDSSWRKSQAADGGWPYGRSWDNKPPSVAMTAAGVATLFISRDELIAASSLDCKGNQADPEIDKGIAWIAAHFKDIPVNYMQNYTRYGIERIGAAGGLKFIGDIDWYKTISAELLKEQHPDGSWGDSEAKTLPETCYGLVFLARGQAPVLMNKLQYSLPGADGKLAPANWNQRPRDVHHFTQWCASQLEMGNFFNWQVINLDVPVEQMHDAPILFICGDQPLAFNDEQVKKLKTFVEQGGMIVFNADCGSTKFSDSAQKLAVKMFPQYALRDLPADHLIFHNEQFQADKWRPLPRVLAMSNGVREMIVLCPTLDLSRAWQAGMTKTHAMEHQLGVDLVLYASGKTGLRKKGADYVATIDPAVQTSRAIKVARIKYDGNWDPEPGGWRQLAAVMHNVDKVDLQVSTVELKGDGPLKGFTAAHLTGTDKLKLDDDAWKILKDFTTQGGTLIIDAAGGSTTFADDAKSQLEKATGATLKPPLDLTSAVYNQPGDKVDAIEYRLYAHRFIASPQSPHVSTLESAARINTFFSPEDISEGLVGEPVDGVIGYSPDTATALMRAMVLYAGSKGN